LPVVLADELEADWVALDRQGQGDPKYGDQNTDGSRSVWQFLNMPRRRYRAADARAAAAQPGTFRSAEPAQNGFVVHAQRPQACLWRPRESRGDDAGAGVEPGAAEGSEGLALYRQAARDRGLKTSSAAVRLMAST
jgi:hypothetical protein